MLEILEFIFQDFAHWLGALGLLVALTFFRVVEVNVDRSTVVNGAQVEEVEADEQ